MKRLLLVVIVFISLCSSGYAGDIVDLVPERPGSLFCWSEKIDNSRPVMAYFIMIDLTSEDLEVVTICGDDPDGQGPAESSLTRPIKLFNKYNAAAAINANAFKSMQKPMTDHPFWYENQPVDIYGLVVENGKKVSRDESGRTSFWVDKNNKPHIGSPLDASSVDEAVADWFSPLLIDNEIIPDNSNSELHPRTAIGFDESGKWLIMTVVDGRQPGYSEGVSLFEMAEIMKSKGCTQAINLDGGGSSVMLVREQKKRVRVLNRPSDGEPRPVPVMLGVRKKK